MPHTASLRSLPNIPSGFALKSVAIVSAFCLMGCDVSTSNSDRFISRSKTPVYPITDTTFEVGLRPGQPFRAFWCSAADYARRVKGADWNDRIYVLRSLGRGRISDAPDAVEFSLDPVAQAAQPSVRLSFNAFEVGENRSVSSANGDCQRQFSDDFDE
ncbi:hypothetical protein TRM7557_00276 [Tritonibacter multivorans]|uniref:Uncharacterized protein n=1 Tax=Tritonibacter multivorans TaxID=928856 RepID=A0A0P1G0G4_9RHOB|nr:hypothetical protein [Tritonibacter multivorans]MDA7419317.1 hypothetical protein [Tritonibacter multivorans]CUH75218.1 hypothetical protein TRM7557_00276 [Tritonibacter multivorans]SFD22590.1 hypothetical protein SAMN04488049_10985 [Tritonibacter multivorans]